jgi:chlorophyllide a reductase subunit Y
VGEIFPVDAIMIGRMLEPLGLAAGPVVPTREWRELYGALASPLAAMLHPSTPRPRASSSAAGRPCVGSAPVGVTARRPGSAPSREARVSPRHCARGQQRPAAGDTRRARRRADRCAHHPVGLRGLGAAGGKRLLVEAGADLRYVGHRLSEDALVRCGPRVARGARRAGQLPRVARGGHRGVEEYAPDLAVGTTPVVQHAKERGIPGLYFTNLISARPLMGPAGPGSLAQVINTAVAGRERLARMEAFFDGVGSGDNAGHLAPCAEGRAA